ncbi:MAG: UDP-N-acetylglucosamine 1-carboxyvinyltransferase [Firmicutes bacterium]|nr:UDP-N-acetylglucosamine 1-carboxyvinyltransferase [Bacillota bacterium]MDD3298745.1 UDP-N-acetylglucosamine 1-carboxyvinyltransferase [Bacillota bacterium]MDD3850764.1 UDP-N-acetylglucosamine 1-carboxyvinyltransferase [Bacillota bacterium]MDD4707321.1 UDP-N-acetylglucosamine 1-carboxyvinyltransferase [Bacillota bacterium]
MPKIVVETSPPLKGTVRVSGAKNAILPIIAASLLSSDRCVLDETPMLDDVEIMCEVLVSLGADIRKTASGRIEIDSRNIDNHEAPYELVRRMRASFLVMGPILARLGKARISMPGGCAIGTRPIDLHLKGFKAMGAEIILGYGYVEARAKRLKGERIYLDFPSVGATENIMMAAALAEGMTVIENAAEEPEIVDLANFINKMGGRVKGAGTDTIRIEGVEVLGPAVHTVIPDRIEAGTFMIAGAITGGDIIVDNIVLCHLMPIIAKLKEAGVTVEELGNGVRVCSSKRVDAVDIKTLPYPGFPTDMQAQMMALMSVARGTSVIIETVFDNRYMHVNELRRMGAYIKIDGRSAVVQGIPRLTGARVKATDLRAGAALVLAGLVARGQTEIYDIHHLDRGYHNLDKKFQDLGARIQRID